MKVLWFSFVIFVAYNVCSVVGTPTNLEIIGAQNTTIENYPWLVSLWQEHPGPYFFCGAFLISPSWILSAAHCFIYNITFIRAGSSYYASGGVTAEIDEVIEHPDFDLGTRDSDLAVAHLKTPVSGENIQPIALPDPESISIASGDLFNVAGWGTTDPEQYKLSDIIQQTDIPAVTTEDCKKIFGSMITDNMICGGDLGVGSKATCTGDSGDAVLWKGQPVALVSFVYECASPVYPSIFTNLLNHIDWIRNVTSI